MEDFELNTSNTIEVTELLLSLNKREAQIIALRYGLHDSYNRTYREIAEYFHVSIERIRQIEARAHERMRLKRKHPEDYRATMITEWLEMTEDEQMKIVRGWLAELPIQG